MHMKFKDEQGVDCGGVSRDMILGRSMQEDF